MDINNMSVKEIETLEKYIEFKNEAKKLYNTIIKNQKIKLLPDSAGRYILWDDTNNKEYLKFQDNNWYWIADYLHQHYVVPISIDGIYEIMKCGYEHENDPERRGYVNNNSDAIKYFRSYVYKLEQCKL